MANRISVSSWVNMHGLAALRPSDSTRERILAGYAKLPFFGDCPPWNVCASGGGLAWCV